MNLGIYIHSNSLIHKLAAFTKLLIMTLASVFIFTTSNIISLSLLFTSIIIMFFAARIPFSSIKKGLKPALVIAIILLAFHIMLYKNNETQSYVGCLVALRVASMIALASLVTLTTKATDMINCIEKIISFISKPLNFIGIKINAATISFMLSISIRFIPVIFHIMHEIIEAQKARGCSTRSILRLKAIIVPLIIRTLRSADELSDAIDARGYDA